jgi:hypothetical protein
MVMNTFGIPIIPDNDVQRIAALKRYDIVDTPPEASFNKIAELAIKIFKVPIALIALVDAERVYFKANIGMSNVKSVERGISLCSLAILNDEATVFEDAVKEPCLLANPLVAGSFGLKFYAGAPLKTYNNFNIGTICLVDKKPRIFSETERKMLEDLASIVMNEIELRHAARTAVKEQQDLVTNVANNVRDHLNNIKNLTDASNSGELTPIAEKNGLLLSSCEEIIARNFYKDIDLKLKPSVLLKPLQLAMDHLRSYGFIKGLKMKLNVKANPELEVDTEKIQEAFVILLQNTLAGAQHEGLIEIDMLELNKQLYVIFKDVGSSLVDEDLNKLFLADTTLPLDADQNPRMDLLRAKNIIRSHQGKIWSENYGAGEGIKFIIELPLNKSLPFH